MKADNQQTWADSGVERATVHVFLHGLLAIIQQLQEQLQQALWAEQNAEALPVAQRLQVSDAHWVASLVDMPPVMPGRLLVMEARQPHPDWTRLVQVRREGLLEDVPLLVVLQKDNPQVIAEAYQIGADACLVRPVNPAHLLGIALYLLRQGRRRAA